MLIGIMKCEICGVGTTINKSVCERFFINGNWVLVENIPAEVCSHCGEPTFSADTGEDVRQLVQSGKSTGKTVETVVYEYA